MLDVVVGKKENCVRESYVVPEVLIEGGNETVVVDFVEDVDSIEETLKLLFGNIAEILAVEFSEETLEVREEANVDFELVVQDQLLKFCEKDFLGSLLWLGFILPGLSGLCEEKFLRSQRKFPESFPAFGVHAGEQFDCFCLGNGPREFCLCLFEEKGFAFFWVLAFYDSGDSFSEGFFDLCLDFAELLVDFVAENLISLRSRRSRHRFLFGCNS